MPSHWFGWILSHHCPEVKRKFQFSPFFDELGLRFFKMIQNIDKIMKKTMLVC